MAAAVEWMKSYLPDNFPVLSYEELLEYLTENKRTVSAALIALPVLYIGYVQTIHVSNRLNMYFSRKR